MTKKEIITQYKKVKREFGNLVVPAADTPVSIANSLTKTYNLYKLWMEEVETNATNDGFYEELVNS